MIKVDKLEIDVLAHEVSIDGETVDMLPREFDLLLFLASNPGIAFTRQALLDRVWGDRFEGHESSVDVQVCRLRDKLERTYKLPRMIQTVSKFGYRFAKKKAA